MRRAISTTVDLIAAAERQTMTNVTEMIDLQSPRTAQPDARALTLVRRAHR